MNYNGIIMSYCELLRTNINSNELLWIYQESCENYLEVPENYLALLSITKHYQETTTDLVKLLPDSLEGTRRGRHSSGARSCRAPGSE